MAATVEIKPTIDPSAPGAMQELVAATQKLEAAMARLGGEGRRIAGEERQRMRDASQAQRELANDASAAERIRRDAIGQTTRALEDHKTKLAEIARLTAGGQLSPGTAARARVQEIERYTAPAREAEGARRAQEETTARKLLSDEIGRQRQAEEALGRTAAQVWQQTRTPLETYRAKLVELSGLLKTGKIDHETHNRAVADAKTAYENAGSAGTKAFGAEALATIKGYVAGIISIGTAIRVATSYFNDMQAKSQEAAQKASAARGGLAGLASLVDSGTPEQEKAQMDKLMTRARKAYAAGATESLGAAGEFIFQTTSLGVTPKDEAFLTKLAGAKQIQDVSAFTTITNTIQAAFKGTQKPAGTIEEITGKAMEVQPKAPIGMQDIVRASSEAAAFAGSLGMSVDELFGAAAFASKTAPGTTRGEKAASAGTQLKALTRSLVKVTAGLSGGGEEGAPAVALEDAFREAQDVTEEIDQGESKGMWGPMGWDDKRQKGIKTPKGEKTKGEKTKKAGTLTPEQIAQIKGLKGKSLSDIVKGIAGMNLDDATVLKLLGRGEAFQLYSQMRNKPEEFAQFVTASEEGTKGARLQTAMRVAEADPTLLAGKLKAESDAKLEVMEEKRGALYNLAETLQGDFRRKMAKAGFGDEVKWTVAKMDAFYQLVSSNEEYIRDAYKIASPERQGQIRTIMEWDENKGPEADQKRFARLQAREQLRRDNPMLMGISGTDEHGRELIAQYAARVRAFEVASPENVAKQKAARPETAQVQAPPPAPGPIPMDKAAGEIKEAAGGIKEAAEKLSNASENFKFFRPPAPNPTLGDGRDR